MKNDAELCEWLRRTDNSVLGIMPATQAADRIEELLDILQENECLEHAMEQEQEREQRQVTREMAQDAQDLSLEGTYI